MIVFSQVQSSYKHAAPLVVILAFMPHCDRLGIFQKYGFGERTHEVDEKGGFLFLDFIVSGRQWVRMFHESRSNGRSWRVMRRAPGVIGDPTPPLPPTLLTQGSAEATC